MENLCILTDFDVSKHAASFESISCPRDLASYQMYCGGNFIFISNERQYTIRFSHKALKKSEISEAQIRQWINRARSHYPNF